VTRFGEFSILLSTIYVHRKIVMHSIWQGIDWATFLGDIWTPAGDFFSAENNILGRCYDHNFRRFSTIFGEKIGVFLKNQML
jgi:hypothetical protein